MCRENLWEEKKMRKLRKLIYYLLTFLLLLQPFLTLEPTVVAASESSAVTAEREEQTVQISIIISEETNEIPLLAYDVPIEEGDTVIDALIKAAEDNQIELDYTGEGDSAYVRGIAGVSEFSRGPLSGWMYRVNGIFPNRGAGAVPLIPSDNVEWLYTTNLGLDLGAELQPFRGNLHPTLDVEGLIDQAIVNEKELVFQVKAKSYFGTVLTPTVQVNDAEVPILETESIVAELHEGENLITIAATDQAGRTTIQTYTIIYEKSVDEQVPEQPEDDEDSTDLLEQITTAIDEASSHILEHGVDSEWEAIGIARAGKEVPQEYINILNQRIAVQINEALENGRIKITDIERLAIAAVAIGLDPENIQGHNLIELIYNSPERTGGFDTMTFQGNNGPIFALIALDTLQFPVPDDAKWTRQKLIDELLRTQNDDGSWSLNEYFDIPSVDITGMALIGLSPYQEQEAVKQALDRGVAWLSIVQTDNGGFDGGDFVGGITSEATAQVIIGLTSYGIDPTSELFTKNGNNLITHLLSYQNPDGGFKHTMAYDYSDPMATEQALQALVAYEYFLNGKGRLYDFPDVQAPGKDDENGSGQDDQQGEDDSDQEDEQQDDETNHETSGNGAGSNEEQHQDKDQGTENNNDDQENRKGQIVAGNDDDQDNRTDQGREKNDADQGTDGVNSVNVATKESQTNEHNLQAESEQELPVTATNMYHMLLIGGMIMILGMSLFIFSVIRKKKEVS